MPAFATTCFLPLCLFPPSPSLSPAGGFATRRGEATCATPFPGQMAVSEATGAGWDLPEQSAASRCRLIVSESRGSGGRVPALPEWKQISSFTPASSRERASKRRNITGQARKQGTSVAGSRTSVACQREKRATVPLRRCWWHNSLINIHRTNQTCSSGTGILHEHALMCNHTPS